MNSIARNKRFIHTNSRKNKHRMWEFKSCKSYKLPATEQRPKAHVAELTSDIHKQNQVSSACNGPIKEGKIKKFAIFKNFVLLFPSLTLTK